MISNCSDDRLIDSVIEINKTYDLSKAAIIILLSILRKKKVSYRSLSDIYPELGIPKASFFRAIDELCRLKLITISVDPIDSRMRRITKSASLEAKFESIII